MSLRLCILAFLLSISAATAQTETAMQPASYLEHTSMLVRSPFEANALLPQTAMAAAIDPEVPTILVRYLGYRCAHCVRQLTYLHQHRAVLQQHGIRVVAMSEDDAATNDRLMQRMGYDPTAITLVSDPDNASARTIGALRAIGDSVLDLHASLVVHRGRVLTSVYGTEPYMDVEHLVQTAVRAAKPVETPQDFDPQYLRRYLDRPVTAAVIAGPDDGIKEPLDLDFNKGVLHSNDLWVVTTDRRGHGIVIVHDAATPQQSVRLKKDSRASHFMWRSTGIAFGGNGTFATSQSGWPGNGDANYMFMGPTLWSADTAIFASKYQESNDFLASHLDMLHQSPYGMGVAHETDNVFWISDAKYNDVTRYDFRDPHEVGGTDHRDGVIRRYSQVVLTPVDRNRPAHLAYDASTSWLYIVDPGAKRVLRLDTRTGRPVEGLRPPDESLENFEEFSRMDEAVIETVIDTGLVDPVGIDVKGGRLLVGDRATGAIRMYDLATGRPVFMGSIATGATELLGICIGPDDHIWAADRAANSILRLQTAANIVMRPLERVVLAGTASARTATLRFSHDGRGDRTLRLQLRDAPDGWNVELASQQITIGEGGTRDVELRIKSDSGSRPITIEIDAFEIGVNGAAVLRTSVLAVPDDLRRVVVNDGTTET
ncbi:MAG: redoxin domain-containing protein, partial [Candidatus Kapabacteria bacterium]|nr:redoxin domain-containing protein [Candidatus Kapabacteria bacterium]